jgi:diacylglycerol kinase family enzyme
MGAAVLIVNPRASRVTPELTVRVERELAAAGRLATLVTERPWHAAELAAEASRSCERIYVYAGDGGFNEAVNGIHGTIAAGFIPGGGTSVLPRALGLPRDPVECARSLARSRRVRRISLGRVNGRRFTFAAGLGLDAELLRRVDVRDRLRGERPHDAEFLAGLARIFLERRGRLAPAMTVLGRGRAAFALVANADPYTYVGRVPVHVAPAARFDLGLDLVAPVELRARQLPRLAWSVLVRPTHTRAGWVTHAHDVDEIRIECDRPTPLQADGEDLGDVTYAVFRAERNALDAIMSA